MEAETSWTCNLEVEKLKPEDIPGAVIENKVTLANGQSKN